MLNRRERRTWWTSLLGLFLAAEAAQSQEPTVLPAPTPTRRVGPIRRALRHVGRTIHDDIIGDPDNYAEPPLGTFVNASFAVMRAKAEPHGFTLYRSDFLVDSTAFSPYGASRIDRIGRGLPCWLGPVIVEPTPDRPGLAEARRDAVIDLLQRAGHPVGLERVVIGSPVAPGLLGTDAANNYQALISRDQQAPAAYSLTPTNATAAGGAPGGGGSGPR